jgi:hypothetical protein
LTAFSNDTDSTRKRELTKYLAKGAECIEISIKKDSLILSKDSQITNYKLIGVVYKQKDSINEKVKNDLNSALVSCSEDLNKNSKKLAKVKRTRNNLIISNLLTGVLTLGSLVLLFGL